jgi:hypothetical protein
MNFRINVHPKIQTDDNNVEQWVQEHCIYSVMMSSSFRMLSTVRDAIFSKASKWRDIDRLNTEEKIPEYIYDLSYNDSPSWPTNWRTLDLSNSYQIAAKTSIVLETTKTGLFLVAYKYDNKCCFFPITTDSYGIASYGPIT